MFVLAAVSFLREYVFLCSKNPPKLYPVSVARIFLDLRLLQVVLLVQPVGY